MPHQCRSGGPDRQPYADNHRVKNGKKCSELFFVVFAVIHIHVLWWWLNLLFDFLFLL